MRVSVTVGVAVHSLDTDYLTLEAIQWGSGPSPFGVRRRSWGTGGLFAQYLSRQTTLNSRFSQPGARPTAIADRHPRP